MPFPSDLTRSSTPKDFKVGDFPPELLLQIFKCVRKHKDRVSLSSTSRGFRAIFAPVLFKTLTLRFEMVYQKPLKPGYTHCHLHGWYDGTESPCHGDLNKGTRPISLDRHTPYNHCGYFSSGLEANRKKLLGKWTPGRLTCRDPATAPLAVPLNLVQELVVTVETACSEPQGFVIPFILNRDSTPKLTTVRVLTWICPGNFYGNSSTWKAAVAANSSFIKSICAGCTQHGLELHLTIAIASNEEGHEAPLEVMQNISGVTSLAFLARVNYAWGAKFEDEVRALIGRSPALQEELASVGAAGWKAENFLLGPRQESWIKRNEGRYSGFLQPYENLTCE